MRKMVLKEVCQNFCIYFFITATVFRTCLTGNHWSYDDDHGDGPSNWKNIYPDCGKSQQSPIDIKTSVSIFREMEALKFEGYDTVPKQNSYKIINNGHTVQLSVENSDIKISKGDLPGTYKLAQFHLHWGSTNEQGSEHTLNGKPYPMEIHFVHYNDRYENLTEAAPHRDGLAVVGVFFEIGDESHRIIDQLTEKFCAIKYKSDETEEVSTFPMDELLPKNRKNFFRYNGSLTTPGCTESVTWTVLTDTVKISQTQLNAFRALGHYKKGSKRDSPLVDNFRPIQSIGSRDLLRNHKDVVATSNARSNIMPSLLLIILTIMIRATAIFPFDLFR